MELDISDHHEDSNRLHRFAEEDGADLQVWIVSLVILSGRVDVEALREAFRNNPSGVRFSDLVRLCDEMFGQPRRTGGQPPVYRMP